MPYDLVIHAADRDVAIQRWSSAAIGGIARAGVVLGYGAIAASEIAEGLRRLRQCFAG